VSGEITIRPATRSDLPRILAFIRELAVYEHLEHEVVASEAEVGAALFGPLPAAEVVFACLDGTPVGFALFFHNFSTFLGRPGIYLEDLYVLPEARGLGIGKRLLAWLARTALERGCARLDWAVLEWNQSAIDFYERLGAHRAGGWFTYRISGEGLARFADEVAPRRE